MFDIKTYIDEKLHPGGSSVLKHVIGKDVGRYLNGSHTELNLFKYQHSGSAYKHLFRFYTGSLPSLSYVLKNFELQMPDYEEKI